MTVGSYGLFGGGPQDVNKRFGTLTRVSHDHVRVVGDIAGYQLTDPDPTDLDMPANPTESNPYGIAAHKHGRVLVTMPPATTCCWSSPTATS